MPFVPSYQTLHGDAKDRLDPQVYAYVATGSGAEETLAANELAWREALLRPRFLRDVSETDTRTTVLGTPISAPIGVAPVGFQRLVHSEGEVATARGAAAADTLFVLSTRSTTPFASIVDVCGPWWFQVYVLRDRALTADLVRRAVDGGARALVLTVDTPHVAAKARESTAVATVSTALVPELVDHSDEGIRQAPDVTWAEIAWLREISGGLPVVVKGVLRGDDARRCVDAGAAALWVSNHGGRQLDGVVPTAMALAEIADAVSTDVELYVDGGIRTGRDVLRALALGARAVFLGRPVSWALATAGADGVRTLLDGLRTELEETFALVGCRFVTEITRDLVRTPW
ncbi:MAG TPA: alpha-hydroxy acid oxidase [Actinopolymorphaceae bacterium]